MSGLTDDRTARYDALQKLKMRVDAELVSVERGLRVSGLMRYPGRPAIAPTHTVTEAREAHRLFSRGERTAWVIDGERQYQREAKQRRRGRRLGGAA